MWPSWIPGITIRPPRSMTSVAGPMKPWTPATLPA
jgi:hypothetical protein